MGFAPEYVSLVLSENFEDAKRLLFAHLMSVHRAHLVMLRARDIVSPADARALRGALDGISADAVSAVRYDGRVEDLFCYVNGLLEAAVGAGVAGQLHTARSRNDIDMTMYRMHQRQGLLALQEAALGLRDRLVALAERHRYTLIVLHTHTQPAQPSTVAHYLLAAVEQLERDAARLAAAYAVTNRCPLGACAITGTGFPIDRQLTSDLLGFDAPTGNTYGSIATVDYLLQTASAGAVLLTGLGRLVQDLLLWCSAEFGYLRLGDGFVQGSSIMPQKRNPVALEHARAICSRALGSAAGVMLAVHNTPFGDIVDTEDDLQPVVDRLFTDAVRAVTLVSAAMSSAVFDPARLEARARTAGTTLTELADTLVREQGICFEAAHTVAARIAAVLHGDASADIAPVLASASLEITGRRLEYPAARLAEILSPRRFVEVRGTPGGPAPEATAAALDAARAAMAADGHWIDGAGGRLDDASARLRERSAAL